MISINNYEYRIPNVICASPEQEAVETYAPIITKMKGAQKTNPQLQNRLLLDYTTYYCPFHLRMVNKESYIPRLWIRRK